MVRSVVVECVFHSFDGGLEDINPLHPPRRHQFCKIHGAKYGMGLDDSKSFTQTHT